MSAMILGLVAIPLTEIFYSGLRTLDTRADDYLIASALRSRMELLLSTDFQYLSSGSTQVTVRNTTSWMSWSVNSYDLDGDSLTESGVRQIRIAFQGRILSTIVTDHEGRVGKIP